MLVASIFTAIIMVSLMILVYPDFTPVMHIGCVVISVLYAVALTSYEKLIDRISKLENELREKENEK